MKKFLNIVLLLIIALALIGCAEDQTNDKIVLVKDIPENCIVDGYVYMNTYGPADNAWYPTCKIEQEPEELNYTEIFANTFDYAIVTVTDRVHVENGYIYTVALENETGDIYSSRLFSIDEEVLIMVASDAGQMFLIDLT